jgi:hypothetical protein
MKASNSVKLSRVKRSSETLVVKAGTGLKLFRL